MGKHIVNKTWFPNIHTYSLLRSNCLLTLFILDYQWSPDLYDLNWLSIVANVFKVKIATEN